MVWVGRSGSVEACGTGCKCSQLGSMCVEETGWMRGVHKVPPSVVTMSGLTPAQRHACGPLTGTLHNAICSHAEFEQLSGRQCCPASAAGGVTAAHARTAPRIQASTLRRVPAAARRGAPSVDAAAWWHPCVRPPSHGRFDALRARGGHHAYERTLSSASYRSGPRRVASGTDSRYAAVRPVHATHGAWPLRDVETCYAQH